MIPTKIKRTAKPSIKEDDISSLEVAMACVDLSDCMSYYEEILKANKYINERSESKSDVHSFTVLSEVKLTQSQNIQLGICMETFLSDAVKSNKRGWVSVREKTKKGEKETDHLYAHHETKKIIYCEQKDNINLDTEKSKITKNKIGDIVEKFKGEYSGYDVSGHILAARYLDASEDIAASLISRKYSDVSVLGVNNFLAFFDLPPITNYDIYKKIIGSICKKKFIGL
jgi:hypothetical protein